MRLRSLSFPKQAPAPQRDGRPALGRRCHAEALRWRFFPLSYDLIRCGRGEVVDTIASVQAAEHCSVKISGRSCQWPANIAPRDNLIARLSGSFRRDATTLIELVGRNSLGQYRPHTILLH
jgi:hypothetical protein